ncbi:hypothetical protein AN944_03981 [Shewanella sp. P1-14-1]|uniref:hypothetical protein n=1 Tax=Shewanella sp. P1-14-1 TaxID=1723761 RepID=UPI0006D66C0E|nr:hypothetical protein [Shewanella sp. P1-14-1]KPZ67639.1 hypothetical protein AN944_03981 [Shewanella sp. P1-14-1]
MSSTLIPFRLVIEKVPFLEYFFRMSKFIVWPKIRQSEIAKNDLRFALVDLVLSFSVFSVLIALTTSSATDLSFKDVTSIFNFEWVVLSFIYYSFVPAFFLGVFYLAYFTWIDKREKPFASIYLLALHFLRTHSITVVLALYGFSFILSLYFNHGIHPKHFGEYFASLDNAKTYSIIFIVLFLWIYLLPLTFFCKSKKGIKAFFVAFVSSLIIYFSALQMNMLVPAFFVKHSIDAEKLCEVTKKSNFYNKQVENNKKLIDSGVCKPNKSLKQDK